MLKTHVSTFAFSFRCGIRTENRFRFVGQVTTLDRRRDACSDQTIEPMVVGQIRAGFPFVDGSPATFDRDRVFAFEVSGECFVGSRRRFV